MKKRNVATFNGGVKRIRQTFIIIAGIVVFFVIGIYTSKTRLITPNNLVWRNNASNYIVKMGTRNDLTNISKISSTYASRSTCICKTISNSTSPSSVLSKKHPRPVNMIVYNSSKQTNISPLTTTGMFEYNQRAEIGGVNVNVIKTTSNVTTPVSTSKYIYRPNSARSGLTTKKTNYQTIVNLNTSQITTTGPSTEYNQNHTVGRLNDSVIKSTVVTLVSTSTITPNSTLKGLVTNNIKDQTNSTLTIIPLTKTETNKEYSQGNDVSKVKDSVIKTSVFTLETKSTKTYKPDTTLPGFTTKSTTKHTYFPQKYITSNQNCSKDFKSRHLMTVNIYGRTGNALFEVCTLLAAADDACYTPFLPTEQILPLETTFDIRNIVRKDVNRSTSNFLLVGEQGWATYERSIFESIDLNKNITLYGYFQTFKNFHHKRDLVQSSVVFKREIMSDVMEYFSNMSLYNETKIGIHIRRGDFVEERNVKLGYFSPSKEFIFKAINHFTNISPKVKLAFIIVSDNITWCRENIKHKYVYYSPFTDAGRDLYILTQCNHNVVTSGSFGWMGAWLNETGTVVYDKSYPKIDSWLRQGYRKEDYYPSWWIGL